VPSLLTISVLLTVQALVVLDARELRLSLPQFPLADLCICVVFAQLTSRPEELVARAGGSLGWSAALPLVLPSILAVSPGAGGMAGIRAAP